MAKEKLEGQDTKGSIMEEPKSLTDIFKSDKFKNSMSEMASKYALPALLATVGTGALGGVLSASNKIDFESPAARRKRILRSALFPALTTAGALAAFGGTKLLSDINTSEIDKATIGETDNIVDKFIKNHGLVPLGAVLGFTGSGTEIGMPSAKSKNPLAIRPNDSLISFGVDSKGRNPIHSLIDMGKVRHSAQKGTKVRAVLDTLAKFTPRLRSRGSLGKVLGLTALGTIGGSIADDAANTVLY